MAKRIQRPESRAKEIWRTVGRTNPYNKVMLWMLALWPLLPTLLFDGPVYGLTNPNLWLSGLASSAVMMVAYLLFMLPFHKVPRLQRSAFGKASVMVFVYLLKIFLALLILTNDPAQAFEVWLVRAPGDISVTFISWVALSVAITSNLDYRLSLAKLNEISGQLDVQRQARARAADVANQKLKYMAIDTLATELDKITNGLRSITASKDAWRISAEIKNLVEKKVRPLSQDLVKRIDLLSKLEFADPSNLGPAELRHLRVSPRLDSRFGISYLAASLNIAMTVGPLTNAITAAQVWVVSMTSPMIAIAMTALWRKAFRFRLEAAFLWTVFALVLSYLPTLWIINYSARAFPVLEPIQLTAFLLIMFLAFAFTMWAAFQRARDEQLIEITEEQNEIQRELALIDQAIWLARRKWAYLIHGSVQGALTVASSRLVFNAEPSSDLVAQVLKDVEKAKRALVEPVDFAYKTAEMCQSIQKAWRDICEIHFDISPEVIQRLDASESGRACFVELAKELVSNAYRHGKAGNVWISLIEDEQSNLKLSSRNDGLAFPKNFEPSVGFQMFDELTQSWSIEDPKRSMVVAIFPID
jgi:signal transduction histidine kinase